MEIKYQEIQKEKQKGCIKNSKQKKMTERKDIREREKEPEHNKKVKTKGKKLIINN